MLKVISIEGRFYSVRAAEITPSLWLVGQEPKIFLRSIRKIDYCFRVSFHLYREIKNSIRIWGGGRVEVEVV